MPNRFAFIGRSIKSATKDSSLVAMIALAVSISSAFFAWYQWSDARSVARKTSAAEISKAYLSNIEYAESYMLFIFGSPPHNVEPTKENLRERQFVDFLDYVSDLANDGLIDNRYVANRIKCDIRYVDKKIQEQRLDLTRAATRIRIYVQNGLAGGTTGCFEDMQNLPLPNRN